MAQTSPLQLTHLYYSLSAPGLPYRAQRASAESGRSSYNPCRYLSARGPCTVQAPRQVSAHRSRLYPAWS